MLPPGDTSKAQRPPLPRLKGLGPTYPSPGPQWLWPPGKVPPSCSSVEVLPDHTCPSRAVHTRSEPRASPAVTLVRTLRPDPLWPRLNLVSQSSEVPAVQGEPGHGGQRNVPGGEQLGPATVARAAS